MIQRHPSRVVITTPKGRLMVARRLYERLQARMQPDDLGLLRDYDWWVQLSELINGIQTFLLRRKGRPRHEDRARCPGLSGAVAGGLGHPGAD